MTETRDSSGKQEGKQTVYKDGSPVGKILDMVALPTEDTAAASSRTMVEHQLKTLIESVLVKAKEQPVSKVDKNLLDTLISEIDSKMSQQLDVILHHEEFQKLESGWRGLRFLVDRTDFRKNIRIDLLNVSKDTLRESFEDAAELIQSPLYRKVYADAYDTPGGFPYGTLVSNYEFENNPQDTALLQSLSKVSAAALCPFIGSVGPKFFGKKSMDEWKKIPDKTAWMETADFIKWRSFRDSEDSRYVGLTFPKFLLRLPYGPDTIKVKGFGYAEDVKGTDHSKYLWGNSSFAMAANMSQAFAKDGWCVQIRGPKAGGKVDNLPVHLYDVGKGKQMKIPTEIFIDDTLQMESAKLGFIPLSQYLDRDYACFFSADSAQLAKEYVGDKNATASSRINARLPYIFLASRIAHYLKVIQRENIGATKDKDALEQELNTWIKTLVTKKKNAEPELVARCPLREALITVTEEEDNPGFFSVGMKIQPHFQIEGMDINLSLVGRMPKAK